MLISDDMVTPLWVLAQIPSWISSIRVLVSQWNQVRQPYSQLRRKIKINYSSKPITYCNVSLHVTRIGPQLMRYMEQPDFAIDRVLLCKICSACVCLFVLPAISGRAKTKIAKKPPRDHTCSQYDDISLWRSVLQWPYLDVMERAVFQLRPLRYMASEFQPQRCA